MSDKRGPSISARFNSTYIGIIGVESVVDSDSVFLTTYDDRASRWSFSSASSYHTRDIYLTKEETVENIYPCAFVAKV